MKKVLSILTASILVGSLMVGCSSDTSDTSKDSDTKVKVEKEKEKSIEQVEQMVKDNVKLLRIMTVMMH